MVNVALVKFFTYSAWYQNILDYYHDYEAFWYNRYAFDQKISKEYGEQMSAFGICNLVYKIWSTSTSMQ